jgi:hypothetical protein
MRRYLAACVLVFSLFSLPVFLPAQQLIQNQQAQSTAPTAPIRDLQAMAVLQATLAAMGGQGAPAIQDTVVQATVTPPADMPGAPGTLTITTKGTGMIRTDGSGGGKTASTIFNNGRELRSTGQGWATAHAANANHKRIEHLPVLMIFQEIARGEISATYVGQETLDGRSVHHISIARVSSIGNPEIDQTMTRNSQLEVFVDAQTNLVTKVSYLHISETDWRMGLPMEIYYGDYRNVGGIAVPFHQRHFYAGRPIGEMQITFVAVNQGTPDSTFKGN